MDGMIKDVGQGLKRMWNHEGKVYEGRGIWGNSLAGVRLQRVDASAHLKAYRVQDWAPIMNEQKYWFEEVMWSIPNWAIVSGGLGID